MPRVTAYLWMHFALWAIAAFVAISMLPTEPGYEGQKLPVPMLLFFVVPLLMCGWTLYLLIRA